MNSLNAVVTQIKSEQNLNIVTFVFAATALKMMSLELPKAIKTGSCVTLYIKPTAIAVGKDISGTLSYSNKLDVTLKDFEKGSLLCALYLDFHSQILEAIITKDSFELMGLQKQQRLTAFIKAGELSIQRLCDD